ncbi:MAG: Calx-beta domain-containing protein [Alphaproteobacteria bacterium]
MQGRPELTKEIIEAALKIDPEKAQKILVAAMRANPHARDIIMRIARQRGSLRGQSMLGLFLAVFLYEMFGNNRKIEARERDDNDERRSAVPETYLAWFIAAAVQLSILFDTDSMQRFSDNLGIRLDFEDPLTTIARLFEALEDLALPKIARDTPADEAENIRLSSILTGVPPGTARGPAPIEHDNDKNQPFVPGDFAAPNDSSPDGRINPFRGPALDLPRLFTLLPGGGLGHEGFLLTPPPDDRTAPLLQADGRGVDAPPPLGFELPQGENPFFPNGEAADEAHFLTFYVYRSGDLDTDATAYFQTRDGTALAGEDFIGTSGSIAFAAGQHYATVTVQLIDDKIAEVQEYFALSVLDIPTKAFEVGNESLGVIVDNEKPGSDPITWTLTGDLLVTEDATPSYVIGYGGGPLADDQSISIQLMIVFGKGEGAADESDFVESFLARVQAAIDELGPDSGIVLTGDVLTFTAGSPESLTIELPLLLDAQIEGFENFTIMIANPTEGTILPGHDVVTTAIADISQFASIEGDSDDNHLVGNSGQNYLRGFGGNDVLDGGGNADRLEGGEGADIFILHVPSKFGIAPSVILDFNTTESDEIQISDVLTDIPASDSLEQFARVFEKDGNTTLEIDRDGSGENFDFAPIAVLLGVTGVAVDQLFYPPPDGH